MYGYDSHMESATISKLKNNLSAYLRKVRAGHTIVIYDRDVPIARLQRIESKERGADRLELLSAQGVIKAPLRPLLSPKLRSALSAPVGPSAQVLKALQQDRKEDR